MTNLHILGTISACIGGDHRYTTIVRVINDADQGIVVQRLENGAVGGMDGPGNAYGMAVRCSRELGHTPSAKVLLAAVRDMFDDTITTYGKPTKNFQWRTGYGHTIATGLSAAKAKAALAEAR